MREASMVNVQRQGSVVARLAQVTWRDAPIPTAWVVRGSPRARCADLSQSSDGMAYTATWDCSAGSFDWHNDVDETAHILEGEVTVTDAAGVSSTLRPGDVALFRAGTIFHWEVPHYVRKIAFMRHTAPPLLGRVMVFTGRARRALARKMARVLATKEAAA
jgi:uncharacterized cupin superfamily protein